MIQTTLGALAIDGRWGGQEKEASGRAAGQGVSVTVTETVRGGGALLILLCDLGQDTDLSGNSHSQIPGRVRST